MTVICRDCASPLALEGGSVARRCPLCASPRLISHAELDELAIAHVDCDAFYASVEKRDDPRLRDKPVIVGGGKRGVVSAACYVARIYGVRSAMPMFKALKLCPQATVIHPDMRKYQEVGREVRRLMLETTPLVEPLSIDEAFLDLSGTARLHHGSPARTLVRLQRHIEEALGITVSIGLSYNKFLAKVASDLDKPRGFSVIGRSEAKAFLVRQPVSLIWGVGNALRRRLEADGIHLIGQLAGHEEADLIARYGAIGRRLYRFARGEDARSVDPSSLAKSISAETTFEDDLSSFPELKAELWPLCETVARRLKRAALAGRTITLKLKGADFRILTRSRTLAAPTQLAEALFQSALPLLAAAAGARHYRLIGIGASALAPAAEADPPNLLDPSSGRVLKVERAIDAVREKLGGNAIVKGRGFRRQKSEARNQKTDD
ncbi:MAG TPA: DNA polymerase IV [Alphaproteobacteria bacterium]|nr:DNA polymerase IV [Alphaproteobacteria bacterium]